MRKHFMDCVGGWCWLFAGGKCYLHDACVWLGFSKFVDCKGVREMGFVVGGLGGVGEFAGDFLVLAAVGD